MKYTKKCLECSKNFIKSYYRSLKSWKKSKYCSASCYGNSLTKTVRGKNNPNWKSGINFAGHYYKITDWNHPYADRYGRIYLHRYIVEKKMGRFLKPNERIHHINGIKIDNRIENLYLFKSHSEHMKVDNRWHKCTIDKSNLI